MSHLPMTSYILGKCLLHQEWISISFLSLPPIHSLSSTCPASPGVHWATLFSDESGSSFHLLIRSNGCSQCFMTMLGRTFST